MTASFALAFGIHMIMSTYGSYKVEDFFGENPINSSEFFGLTELINYENKKSNTSYKKSLDNKGKNKKNKFG